jgi:hypothetical protein
MYTARPQIPLRLNQGDAITAAYLNKVAAMAGYFEGTPIDPTILGSPIEQGRPVLMKVSDSTFGTGGNALDNVSGNVVTLKMAFVNPGASTDANPVGFFNVAETTEDVIYPGICVDGGSFSVGQTVIAIPFNTISGLVFFFNGNGKTLYRASDFTVIIADRRWYYQLTPQRVQSDGITWEDDPDGIVLENCYNEAEALNSAGDTLQSNDVDFSLPPFSSSLIAKKLQPIKENRMVELTRFTTSSGSAATKIAWFNAPNIVQEGCIT